LNLLFFWWWEMRDALIIFFLFPGNDVWCFSLWAKFQGWLVFSARHKRFFAWILLGTFPTLKKGILEKICKYFFEISAHSASFLRFSREIDCF
jgi:hypothetical protein